MSMQGRRRVARSNARLGRRGLASLVLSVGLMGGAMGQPALAGGAPAACSLYPSVDGSKTDFSVVDTTPCTWTVPENVTSIDIAIIGSGGGGGGAATDLSAAGGGGGGGEVKSLTASVTPGAEIVLTVGAAGTGGAVETAGQDGGDTSVGDLLTALGGTGGGAGTSGQGGTGGASGAKTGGAGSSNGGGGGGAGPAANGTAAGGAGGGAGGGGETFAATIPMSGGGGGGGVAAAGGAEGAQAGRGGGTSVPGDAANYRGGGGGGGGVMTGAAQAGGNGAGGRIRIAYATLLEPFQQTLNGTAGTAITPTAVLVNTLLSDKADEDNQKVVFSVDPGSPALPAGLSLNSSTGVVSGTPSAQQAVTTVTILGTANDGYDDFTGFAEITITIAAGSGGGGGGGGDTPESPSATPSPTPSPTASARPSGADLGPTTPGANPNLPAGGVPLGGSVFLVNGQPVPINVRPDAPRSATGLDIQGPGFLMRLSGRTANDRPLGLTADGALVLEQDRTAYTEGSGFKPNSEVRLYVFSEPRFLGAVQTDATGSFRGSVPLPLDIKAGRHTLQSNGLAPDGAVRSLSLGVQVQPIAAGQSTQRSVERVFFARMSATLDATAKADLRALVKKSGTKAQRVSVVGYVQPSSVSSNDHALSTARARNVAAYLRSLGLSGAYAVRGDGTAEQTGAAARRVDVAVVILK